jgi:hypothetical protein
VTREITSNNYLATCAELIVIFGKALEIVANPDGEGTDEHLETSDAAFKLAQECGWDWEHDEEFASWALKATGQEILVEGLTRALVATRSRHLDHIRHGASNGGVA